jgi:hypothetical protein
MIVPANRFQDANSRLWIEFVGLDVAIMKRVIRGKIAIGHLRKAEEYRIHHLLAIQAQGQGLTHALIAEEMSGRSWLLVST